MVPGVKSSSMMAFAMPADVMVTEEEVYNYDFNSFMADVGGYLGLLLGMSVVGLYDVFVGQLEKLEKTLNKKVG